MIKFNKQDWDVIFNNRLYIQLNWVVGGVSLGIGLDYNEYGGHISFSFIKPVISFGYLKKGKK